MCLSWKLVEFYRVFFCINWNDHGDFSFVLFMCCSFDWFSCVEPSFALQELKPVGHGVQSYKYALPVCFAGHFVEGVLHIGINQGYFSVVSLSGLVY